MASKMKVKWGGLDQMGRQADYDAVVLAQLCGLSLRQLERFFLARTGLTPREWLNQLRLYDALVLLAEGKSVKEVYGKVGFKQRSHFARAFKALHGFGPGSAVVHRSFAENVARRYKMSLEDTSSMLFRQYAGDGMAADENIGTWQQHIGGSGI